jgi:CO/xanthine dehydrogenase Mo-binding subunit
MGQGVLTGLAMLVAEELECDWSKVRTEFVSPTLNLAKNRIWGDTSTGASRSIASSQDYLRRAGATAREMLIAAAAAQWRVPVAQCVAANGAIVHRSSGRTLSFAAIAPAAAKVTPPADVALKPPSAWKLAGTPQRRLDVPNKVTGQPVYAIDVRLPNMLYAAIRHCPVFGGALKSVDANSIAEMPGVRGVVRMPDAVAVVADSWWRAKRAADALAVTWDDCGNGEVSTASIGEFVRAGLAADFAADAVQIGRADGDAAAALASAAARIEADYEVPFLAHATMEPQTCTAHVRADGVEIWVPTQDPATALATASLAADVAHDKVTVHRTMLGGEMPYAIPNYRLDYVVRPTPVPLGVWRAINYTQNAFYKECFIDEMAHAAGIDPYLYRRKLLANSPRNLAVLDAAAQHADWNAPPAAGVFRGIALNEACGSYCAQVVEASVKNGEVRVHRVVAAIDPGHVVNPLSVEMQVQGAIVYALTAAFFGEITIKNGAAEQTNFDCYEMLRLADAPKVETVIVPSGGFWGGVGEPPVPPLAPALCNAIFAATGKRVRSLPLKNHDL